MAESIGSVVDKLIVVNVKMYHLVDIIQDPNADDKAVADAARKAQSLNRDRTKLINEINERLNDPEAPIVKL